MSCLTEQAPVLLSKLAFPHLQLFEPHKKANLMEMPTEEWDWYIGDRHSHCHCAKKTDVISRVARGQRLPAAQSWAAVRSGERKTAKHSVATR